MAGAMANMDGSGVDEEDDLVFRKIVGFFEPRSRTGVRISRATDIMADLEIDSVAVNEAVMDIEDFYDIDLPLEKTSEIRTMGDLVDAIHSIKKQQA